MGKSVRCACACNCAVLLGTSHGEDGGLLCDYCDRKWTDAVTSGAKEVKHCPSAQYYARALKEAEALVLAEVKA